MKLRYWKLMGNDIQIKKINTKEEVEFNNIGN